MSEFHGKTPSEYHRWLTLMDQMHFTIASMGKPVIAMVHGYAVANGAGLMAAADFAIVAEGTQIGTTAINVGLLCTGPIIPMSYSLGKKKTLEMLLSGDMIDAKEAERLGLVNKVVPAEKLEEETFAFAQKLIAKSPLAIQIGKEFLLPDDRYAFSSKVCPQSAKSWRGCAPRRMPLKGLMLLLKNDNPCGKGNKIGTATFLGFFHSGYFLYEICNGRLETVRMMKNITVG